MNIIVKCGVCEQILVTVSGDALPPDTEENYQQSASCDQDGQADIQVLKSG